MNGGDARRHSNDTPSDFSHRQSVEAAANVDFTSGEGDAPGLDSRRQTALVERWSAADVVLPRPLRPRAGPDCSPVPPLVRKNATQRSLDSTANVEL